MGWWCFSSGGAASSALGLRPFTLLSDRMLLRLSIRFSRRAVGIQLSLCALKAAKYTLTPINMHFINVLNIFELASCAERGFSNSRVRSRFAERGFSNSRLRSRLPSEDFRPREDSRPREFAERGSSNSRVRSSSPSEDLRIDEFAVRESDRALTRLVHL